MMRCYVYGFYVVEFFQKGFDLIQIALELKINPDFLFSWQTKVYNKIKAVEQLKEDQLNQ